MMLEGKNSINVGGQKVGGLVIIDFAVLEKPGFIAIHEDANGVPGKMVAVSSLIPAGDNKNIEIGSKVENDNYYWTMLHVDNGDGKYDPNDDGNVKDGQGNEIMMKFEGFVEGEKMEEEVGVMGIQPSTVNVETKTHDVVVQNFAFSEKILTVKKGAKVIFTNKDSAPHTATADGGAFDTGNLATGQTGTVDTSKLAAGTYAYHCSVHPTMKATLIVE